MRRKLVVLVLAFAVSLALILSWAIPAAAISNGQPDGSNHPYVCLVVFYDGNHTPLWRTTGVLVSPKVVLTAGHGTYGAAYAGVWFLENIPASAPGGYPYYGGTGSYTGTPHTNPYYRSIPEPGLPGFDYHDVGIVVLDGPAPVTQFAQLPAAGYVDTLRTKHFVDLVGYGVNYQDKGGGVSPYDSWQWLRARYYAPSQLINTASVTGSEFLKLTANPGLGKGGTTFGDSGGPIFDGGTRLILGLNAFVNSYNCTGVTYAQRIDIPDILSWIAGYLP
jgi:Trypsin